MFYPEYYKNTQLAYDYYIEIKKIEQKSRNMAEHDPDIYKKKKEMANVIKSLLKDDS